MQSQVPIPVAGPSKFLLLLVSAVMLGVTACATTEHVTQVGWLESVEPNPRVLLMPPDIRYYLVTAGGVSEPHAEWTEAARNNFLTAVHDYAANQGTALVTMSDAEMSQADIRYRELHRAVGATIINNYFGKMKLPTKGEAFDWSLGPGVQQIGEEHKADYALFVFYRDEQASGGRVAFAVLVAAAGGYMSAGAEYGFASLVDLKTGDIVWFNIVRAGSGELRDPNGAVMAVETLLQDMPTNQ